ncbi:MAG: Slp family lipoprotein [Aquisalimonadaceae bacterium]
MLQRPAVMLIATLSLLLGACATTGPDFHTDGVADLAPRAAASAGDGAVGERVIWGGRIIAVNPLEQGTQLELLAYPLGRNQQPEPDRSSQGRFLVIHPEYLEPADWSPDRLVTVTGTLRSIRSGNIGDAEYRYPEVHADDLYLWPKPASSPGGTSPRVNFGFGVILSR